MVKLINLVKEIKEGAKITFDDKGEVTDIEIAYKQIQGEQLNTFSGVIKKNSYKVFYSLESAPDQPNIKKSEDSLKYDSQLIKPEQLKELLKYSVIPNLPKIDYIGYLESKGGLNKILIDTLKDLCGVSEENVIEVKKIEYTNIDDAVDWDSYNRQSERLKKDIVKFLYKTAEDKPSYKIKKSSGREGGGTQSIIINQLHSKYDLGLNPNLKDRPLPPIYDVLTKCITQGKTLIIVDDNIHAGIDFRKIFNSVEDLVNKFKEVNATPISKDEDIQTYRRRVSMMNNNLNGSHQRIFGYVLYKLDPKDVKK